jgi:tRNA U38,U39,U40 pseudouridine synthase TruA
MVCIHPCATPAVEFCEPAQPVFEPLGYVHQRSPMTPFRQQYPCTHGQSQSLRITLYVTFSPSGCSGSLHWQAAAIHAYDPASDTDPGPTRRRSAAAFVGTHDFTPFSNKPREPGANGNPVKHVVRCDIIELPDGFRVEVHASGFLYRQVRARRAACLVSGDLRCLLDTCLF